MTITACQRIPRAGHVGYIPSIPGGRKGRREMERARACGTRRHMPGRQWKTEGAEGTW